METAYEYKATVVRWIDGDTVELTVDVGFNLSYGNHFRLEGIDTPERGKPGYLEAKARANQIAPPGTVLLATTSKADKYGRWLVYLHQEVGPPINAILLDEGFAVAYWGGTKNAS